MRAEIRAGLWMLFALIVLFGGWLFLRACGTWPMFGWEANFCPVPVDRRAYAREVDIGEGLRRQLHAAEMKLAERPLCPAPVQSTQHATPPRTDPPTPPRTDPPTPPRTNPPTLTPQQRQESKVMDEKVETRRGKRGKLQFTLAWKTLDDLDINVDCPGGRIGSAPGHFGPGICGDGVKDIDANRSLRQNITSDAIENVTWTTDPPEGTYVIEIINYQAKTIDGGTVPFTLRMRWGEQERICRDVVTVLPQSQMRESNGRIISGTYRTITWHSGSDLPNCNFEVRNSLRGAGPK